MDISRNQVTSSYSRYATVCFEQNRCSVFDSHVIHKETAYDNEMAISTKILRWDSKSDVV